MSKVVTIRQKKKKKIQNENNKYEVDLEVIVVNWKKCRCDFMLVILVEICKLENSAYICNCSNDIQPDL